MTFPRFVLSFFRGLNLISLDVVLIALAWEEVFARAVHTNLQWEERAVLAISIWMVYVADHWVDIMVDAHDIDASNKAPRHHFVRSHTLWLGCFFILALLMNVCLLKYLSKNLVIAGIFLACGTAGYLMLNYLFVRRGHWLKGREIIISIVFSIGCGLVAIVQVHQTGLLWLWIMVFSIIAFINCTLIARMERKIPIMRLAPKYFFSPGLVLGFCLITLFSSFFIAPVLKAFCWSLVGLAFVPMTAKRFGYESASLAADQVLFFAALFSLIG